MQRFAGDVSRPVRREPRDGVRDVLRGAEPRQRIARKRRVAQALVSGQRLDEFRLDKPRCDGIHSDVVLALLQRQRACEAEQAGLCGRIVRLAGVPEVRARRNVDDASPALFHHRRQCGFRAKVRALQHGIDDRIPIFSGHLRQIFVAHDLAGLFGLKGWQLLFVLEGLPAVALGVAAWFVLGENVKAVQWLSPREKAIVTSQMDLEQRQPAVHARTWMSEVLNDPRMYAAILGYFAITCATVAISFWVPTIIKTLEVDDVRMIGWLSALPYLAATIGLWAIGRHSDRTQERRWHTALSLIASAVGFMLLGQVSHSLSLTLAMLAVAATGLYGAIPVFWTIPTTYLSRTAAPGGIAMISSIGCLGAFSSTAIIGAVKSLTGSLNMAMGAVGLIMVAAAVILLIAFPRSLLSKPRENA